MTWRLYLKFLRPLRSLIAVTLYALMAWALAEMWWRDSRGEAVLPTLVVALPLIGGLFAAGAAHEPMHQRFAMLLPGLRRSMQAKTTIIVIIMTVAVTWLTFRLWPEIPVGASFGLIVAAMAAPCLGQHRHPGNKWELLLLVLLWALTVGIGGTRLSAAMNTVPWLWLVSGVGAAGAFFALGFSTEVCRLRAGTRFLAPQTMFFNLSIMRDLILERQMAAKQKTSRCDEMWRIAQARRRRVTTWDWVAAMRFGQVGNARQIPMWKAMLRMVLACIVGLAVILFIGGKVQGGPNISILFIVIYYNGLMQMGQIASPMVFPVSRSRLASLVFWRQLELMVFILCLPLLAIAATSWGVYAVAGVGKWFITPQSIMGVGLLSAPFFPLLMACGALLRKSHRVTSALIVGLGTIMLVSAHSFLQSWVLSVPGVLTLGSLTTLGLILLRWQLSVWWGRVDLSDPTTYSSASPRRILMETVGNRGATLLN